MHLTDEQLNEYLDNESTEPMQIEAHLTECADCVARLTALQSLFAEIESLPELTFSRNLAAPFIPPVSLPAYLPRWLTLTLTLQTVAAWIAIMFALPLVNPYLTTVFQAVSVPTLREMLMEIQMYVVMWMQVIQSFQLPTIPTEMLTLPKELSSPTLLSVSLLGIFFLWLVANWWLLRKRPNPLA